MATIKRHWKSALAFTASLLVIGAIARVAQHSPPQCNHALLSAAAHNCAP